MSGSILDSSPKQADDSNSSRSSRRQEELQEILLQYVEAAQAGSAPEREDFLQAHPEFTTDITEFLAQYQQINRLASPLRDSAVRRAGREMLDSALQPVPPTERAGSGREQAHPRDLGQLGDYRLLREIGCGGMGIVYEAEQISLRRKVALKILPFAAGSDSRQLQRFRNEAEAAAHLHHSHIVPVFAVGSERGVHYYTMQYIEGQSLAAVITLLAGGQRQRGNAPQPQEEKEVMGVPSTDAPSTQVAAEISTEHSGRTLGFFQTAAAIGKQTAEALEYAHQMGVVHRDIKPANLLLDARGDVWITDFGLAQFQNQAGLTMTGELLGTLRYISPEQAMAKRGLVDHKTDIYALGATLYEFLTLKPVFDGRDRHALLHQIGFEEPVSPRVHDSSIPFELETIILKALAKNPEERYESAQDLADDLQRFLEDKPIQAKRPGLVDRTRKWMRRHPGAVAAVLIMLAVSVVGFGVSTALILREQAYTQEAYESERVQKAMTQVAYNREKTRAWEAEQRFKLARRSADEMITLAQEEVSDNYEIQNLRRRLLEASLAYYEEFIDLRREDPSAQAELAATRDRVKNILADLALLQGVGQPFLLKHQAVLADLKMSKEQRRRAGDFLRKCEKGLQDLFGSFQRLAPEERQERFVEMARSNEVSLAEILEPVQLHRFRQIALQCEGPMVFREPEIANALKLTPIQKRRIRAIEAGIIVENDGAEHPIPPNTPPWKVREERRKSEMNQILKILTEEQVVQWRELTGTPFLEPIFLPPGPPHKGPPPKGPPPKGPMQRGA